ncbi:MAG: Ppx/GppA phosphatase family protein [Woeseiaceae bacterium]|nr:Ppx/GppA phosphatase family protein [Woeseiaceae bacterium]
MRPQPADAGSRSRFEAISTPSEAPDLLPNEGANRTEVIAAVDLGSNSFHMIVGELRHGQLIIIDRLRETVRLAEGLSDDGVISADARSRALACLSQFGERLRAMRAASVRAAGTSTIRRAREDSSFMAEAEEALGHPIEVISGLEEARLIYQGVTHSLPPNTGFRLVVDIGGGSTEVILGNGPDPRALESLHMGCVSMTERFFPDGRITARRFEKARVAARLELRPVKAFFRGATDVEAIGTSGTIISTERVARLSGLAESGELTLEVIEALIDKVCEFDSIESLAIRGLSERRSQVWPGGLAILAELIGVLRIKGLRVSDGALREGLLYDLLGRMQHEDARERTVRAMAARYHVDQPQSQRVAATAGGLLKQCADAWSLTSELAAKMLDWSARLHEIGLDISHDGFQRHGAYVAEHADMPGFPRAEQRFLAFLIGSQRHSINLRYLQELPRAWRDGALRLALLLRLAVLMNRSRRDTASPAVKLSVEEQGLELKFDPAWLQANPLTVADLKRESGYLGAVGYELGFG